MEAHHLKTTLTSLEAEAPDHEQIVLILIGLIGSGKSTFAEALQKFFPNFRRCNQDDLGNRRKVEHLIRRSLEQGLSVCIDRTNFDESQRRHFLDIARCFPNAAVWALIFETPYMVCASRLETRTNHPTIHSPELGLVLLEQFSKDLRPPTANEGFDRIKTLLPHPTGNYTKEEIATILNEIRNSSLPQSSIVSGTCGFFAVTTAVLIASLIIISRMRHLHRLQDN